MASSPERAADRPRPPGGAALIVGEQHGRLSVSGDIGEKLDDQLEKAVAEANRKHGESAAYKAGAQAVAKLADHARKDHEEDKLTKDELDLVLKWLRRGTEVCFNLAEKAKAEELVANGKAAAFRQSVGVAQRYHTSARSRLDQLIAPDDGEGDAGVTGAQDAHPSDEDAGPELTRGGRVSVAARRKDPEAATRPRKKAAKKKATKRKPTAKKKTTKRTTKRTAKRRSKKG